MSESSSSTSSNSKLDKALGDIIDSERRPRRGGRGGAAGNRRGSGSFAGRQNGGGNTRRNPLGRGDDEEEEGSGPVRRGRQQFRNNAPYSRADSVQQWSHDGFASQQSSSPSSSSSTKTTTVGQTTVVGDTVFVANLANDINDDDLLEIFGRIGSIVRANVNFNSQAQSLGTGEVQFSSNQLAEAAVKELDGAQVDGRTMNVKLVATISRPRTIVQRQPAPQPRPQQQLQQRAPRQINNTSRDRTNGRSDRDHRDDRRGGGGGDNRRSGGGDNRRGGAGGGLSRGGRRGGRGGRRGSDSKPVSGADLDAELDSYQAARGSGAVASSSTTGAAAE